MDTQPTDHAGEPSFFQRRRLIALTVGGLAVEVALLGWLAPDSAVALAPHVTAPEPFAVFHDLRWLLVYHPNWAAFAGELLLLVGLRTAFTTLVVRAAWPRSRPLPDLRTALRTSAVFTVVALAVLSPWAALLLGMAVVSLSWLFFVAVPVVLVVALFTHHAAVTGGWWRSHPSLRSLGWIGLTFAALTVAGAVLATAPPILRPIVVMGAGLFNAWAWTGIVHGVLGRAVPRHRRVPIGPVAVAGMVAVAAVGTTIGFRVNQATGGQHDVRAEAAGGKPVLVVSGFGSAWSGEAQERFGGAFRERRFSYRGTGTDGTPEEYDRDDTLQAIPELTQMMAEQVHAFHVQTGRPVSIVAESEGALVAKAYVAAHPDAPVDRLVMLSPLVRPARAYYPDDSDQGWGVAAAWELRGLTALVSTLTPLSMSADDDIFRSIADYAPLLRGVMPCTIPGVRQLAVLPVADAVMAHEFDESGVEAVDVPEFHGGLLGNGQVQRLVARELHGLPPEESRTWSTGASLLRALASSWQVPELPLSLNPVWEDGGDGDCASATARLRGWAVAD